MPFDPPAEEEGCGCCCPDDRPEGGRSLEEEEDEMLSFLLPLEVDLDDERVELICEVEVDEGGGVSFLWELGSALVDEPEVELG